MAHAAVNGLTPPRHRMETGLLRRFFSTKTEKNARITVTSWLPIRGRKLLVADLQAQGTSGIPNAMVTISPFLNTLIGREWIIWRLMP